MIFRSIIIALLIPFTIFAVDRPSSKHEVYLQGTDYELHIYRIYGKEPGKKGLIIGGIQGDEPGGYLSADLYVDAWLEKGDLIIIPRANFKSIILFNRGPDGDMNRRFIYNKKKKEMDQVVDIIIKLMSEVDFFLHLHDGSGFYSPKYINELRNPNRWGQSVIVDAEKYFCNGKRLNLGEIAKNIVKETNKKITNKNHYFEYFNTDTDNPKTKYKDMKKTATYYALKNFCIPSFGLETSKNLPDDRTKILYKTYLINEFFKIFDIKPELPEINLPQPILKSIKLLVDNETLIIENGSNLNVNKGSKIKIIDIYSNYTRGLSCDILKFNGLNDKGIEYIVNNDTKIICRKDHQIIGSINIVPKTEIKENNDKYFEVMINKNLIKVYNNQRLKVKSGDKIILLNFNSETETPVNLRGFVPPNVKTNEGDDRNIEIIINNKNFIKKYAMEDGNTFEIISGTLDNIKGRILLSIDK
jgi:hypothetical protein